MSGRGKGKSAKKAVSKSAKAGLQFPVGRVARASPAPGPHLLLLRSARPVAWDQS